MGGAHEARLVASLLMFAGFNRFCVSGASGCDRAQGVSAADSPTEVPSGDWMNGVALMAALPSLLCVGDASCNQKLEVKFAQEREALVSTETSPRRKAGAGHIFVFGRPSSGAVGLRSGRGWRGLLVATLAWLGFKAWACPCSRGLLGCTSFRVPYPELVRGNLSAR